MKSVVTNPVAQVRRESSSSSRMVRHGERRILPGFVDDVAAVQEDGGLEQPVSDQMEDGQREGAQAAFHHHVAHLTDR